MSAAGRRDIATEVWRGVASAPALDPDEVHVWKASVSAWAPHKDALQDFLAPEELARAGRFHFAKDRQQFVVARGLLRRLLAHYTGHAPADLQFGTGPVGKPRIDAPVDASSLQFNVSHAADVVLIAVTRYAAVGVDVERWVTDIDFVDLIERFFSPSECSEFLALADDQRRAGFFACWTRKEAYIKATGLGVSRGLDYFDVIVAPDQPPRLVADRLAPEHAAGWRMVDLDVASGHSGALVVAGTDWQPLCFALSPPAEA